MITQEMLPSICKLDFMIGSYFGIREHIQYCVEDKKLCVEHYISPAVENHETKKLSLQELIHGLQELHIGEWREYYDQEHYGYLVMDGIYWRLEIYMDDGDRVFRSNGHTAYPYNFKELLKLLGAKSQL